MTIFILAAARTPLGAFGGNLKSLDVPELGGQAMKETLCRAHLESDRINEVILGCALPAGNGGNPAQRAALVAGIPPHVPAHTPCQGAASGMKAVALAAQSLQERPLDFILAGGADSLSRAPYLAPGARWGIRMGEMELLDSLILDGSPVAEEAEDLRLRFGFDSAAMNAWTDASRQKAHTAFSSRNLEIGSLTVTGRNGSLLVSEDEPPEASRVALTANVAAPADGAASLLLASALPPGAVPLGRILGWVETGSGYAWAIRQLLLRIGLGFEDIDQWEIHEPSAAHVCGLLAEMPELDPVRVNVGGGALALGDPLGASGARLLVSLSYTLQASGLRTGIAVISGGHGQVIAMAITRT